MFEQSWTGVFQNTDITQSPSPFIGETFLGDSDYAEQDNYPKIKKHVKIRFTAEMIDACISVTEMCGQFTVPVDLVHVLNEKVSTVENLRILTPIQAYELALNTLKTFENKWDLYVKEEARLLSVFDEDED